MTDEPVDLSATRVIVATALHQQAVDTIGRCLQLARQELSDTGVRVVVPAELDPILDVGNLATAAERVRGALDEQLGGVAPRVLILCSGRLLARRPLGARKVRDLASRSSIRVHNALAAMAIPSAEVFLHTLRPDNLVTEMQIAHIRAGGRQRFRQRRLGDADRLSQLRLAEAMLDDPRVERLWLRPYELAEAGSHLLFDDFLSTLGIDVPTGPFEFPEAPQRWSTAAIELAVELNRHLDKRTDRRRVHEFVNELLPPQPGRPGRAGSQEVMASIVDRHARENRRLFKRFMPDLDPKTYASESATRTTVADVARRHAPQPARVRHIDRWDLHLPELVLHVGVQKTGTTLAQRSLRTLRPQLHRDGVAYLDRTDIMQLDNLKAWSAYRSSEGADAVAFARELREAVAYRYEAVLDRTGAPPRAVLVSNESLVGVHARQDFAESPFRPRAERAIAEFIDILQPNRVLILVYVRRQDRLLESQYMHLIHGGASLTFDEYATAVRQTGSLHYSDFVDRLSAIDGVDELRARPFEVIGSGAEAFVRDLVSPLDVELDFRRVPDTPTNQSYSDRALQLALDLNPLLPTRARRAQMREFLEELIPASSNPKAQLLDDDGRAAILDEYRSDNEQLFASHMPDFPVDSYSNPAATVEIPRIFERTLAGAAPNESATRRND